MPRVKTNVAAKKKKKRYLRAARGFRGGRSNLIRTVKETVHRAWAYAYRDRKQKKNDFRRLWIVRINAATRLNNMSYSVFMNGLLKAGVDVNRKVLADLAVSDPIAFTKLVETARQNLG